MNILLTSGGRRVTLVQLFKRSLQGKGRVLVTDRDATAPALYCGDQGVIAPPVMAPNYLEFLLSLVESQRIAAIIPLIDPEIPILAGVADRFARLGCQVLTMDVSGVETSADKWVTAQFFLDKGIPTPRTVLPAGEDGPLYGLQGPVIVKPRQGSSSQDVFHCFTPDQVRTACKTVRDPLIQERLIGEEVTIDVLGDLQGRVLDIVQRKRIKVRAGEVERGITISDHRIEELALRAANSLKPRGCINLQCFLTERGPVFTEINPRFGGGYPLSQAAGADFPGMIVRFLDGEEVPARLGQYESGVLMLRYDTEVIIRERDLLS